MSRTSTPPDMEVARRLVIARVKRGLGSAKQTAEFFGWNYDTYIQHERGARGIRKTIAEKYAKSLRVSVGWLLTGEGEAPVANAGSAARTLSIDEQLLREAISFVLCQEGVSKERADLLADILPEALSGPPVDEVGRDAFRSFRIHYQLGVDRSDRRVQQ